MVRGGGVSGFFRPTVATAAPTTAVVTSTTSPFFFPTTFVVAITNTVTNPKCFYLQPCIENVASGEGVASTLTMRRMDE